MKTESNLIERIIRGIVHSNTPGGVAPIPLTKNTIVTGDGESDAYLAHMKLVNFIPGEGAKNLKRRPSIESTPMATIPLKTADTLNDQKMLLGVGLGVLFLRAVLNQKRIKNGKSKE